ncbi:MAG: glycosyltransferase family 4 protein [Clostridia bacterium]|nr:glycosyltransferase family 4 protein [Clostridia bacterium]
MKTINMLSSADKVKGQGVGSAYLEQVRLVEEELPDSFKVYRNQWKCCDIMHYHTLDVPFFLSIPLARLRGSVTVGYVHFLPETVETSLRLPWLVKQAFYAYMIQYYKSMDRLVTVNPWFIERLAEYGIPREKVTYIPNFVSKEEFFRMPAERKGALREAYGLEPDRFTVVCAGQLQVRKGFFDFIKTAERLPELQFVWAGGFSFGKLSDGYDQIKKVVENPPPNVRFLGIVPREEMNAVYNLADVMFLPSFEELFPMTVLESMNCGIPILLRDLELYEDILFDYYLKANCVQDFTNDLLRLSRDPDFYAHYATKSCEGSRFYSREHVAAMWKHFYNGLPTGHFLKRPLFRY